MPFTSIFATESERRYVESGVWTRISRYQADTVTISSVFVRFRYLSSKMYVSQSSSGTYLSAL